jgi:hypothetical protein
MAPWCFLLFENESGKSSARKLLPRIAKAAIKGIIYFALFYILPTFVVSQLSEFAPQLFSQYEQTVAVFAAILIFFVVASELTSGTIYQHALNIGRALILIIFFVYALNGGIAKLDIDIARSQRVSVVVDLRIFLLMLIAIDLLGLAKSVLQAVNFLSEKADKQVLMPRPADNP